MDIQGNTFTVIGGAGFIGSHITDQLIQKGAGEVRVLDNLERGTRDNLTGALKHENVQLVEGSIMDRDLLSDTVAGADGVFHLAALWLGECLNEPRRALEVNVEGTYNVIEAVHEADVQRTVYSSSASVYGNALEVPMEEDHPFNNRTMYGATKIAGEQFFRAFNDMHDLDYVGLRYMNVYGPRMDDKGTYVSVIVKVLRRMDEGKAPLIFGDGKQTYDFVYVDDVARANLLAMQAGSVTDEFFNVGTGVGTSINDLVHKLVELHPSSIEPEYRPEEESFVTHRIGGTEKAKELIGFQADIDVEEGLKRFVDWWNAGRLEEQVQTR